VLLLDEARRLVTAERGAVQRLARQHAGDAEAWQAGLREFYDGYAPRIAERLRMPLVLSREYCGSHGLAVAKGGVSVTEEWETLAIPQLAALALCGDLPGRAGALEDEAQEATS
jgi:hypothetical protein